MKKFKVTASFSTHCTVEIFAENEDAAYEIAHNMDGGQFEPSGSDSWEIDSVDEITPELTREQLAFIEAYGSSVADATKEEVVAFFVMEDDEFIDSHSTGTYGSIMDAYCIWNNAIEFSKAIEKNN